MGVYGQVAGKSSRPKLELHRLNLLVTFGDLTKNFGRQISGFAQHNFGRDDSWVACVADVI